MNPEGSCYVGTNALAPPHHFGVPLLVEVACPLLFKEMSLPWKALWWPHSGQKPCKGSFILLKTHHSYPLLSLKQFSSVKLLTRVRLFVTTWTAAHQASLSITNSWSVLKLMSIESVVPSNHLILCHPLLFPPSIFPSIRVFSNESVVHHQVAKVLEFQLQHQSFQWTPRTDLL